MLTADAAGVFPLAPTPFLPDGSLDWVSTERMIDHYVACGATGVTILGIMGEAPKLDSDEAITFAKRAINRARHLPY